MFSSPESAWLWNVLRDPKRSVGIGFSLLQVSLNFQTSFFQSWSIVICWSGYLILYLVLVRTEEGDRSISSSGSRFSGYSVEINC